MNALVLVLLVLSIICGAIAALAPAYQRFVGAAVALLAAALLVPHL